MVCEVRGRVELRPTKRTAKKRGEHPFRPTQIALQGFPGKILQSNLSSVSLCQIEKPLKLKASRAVVPEGLRQGELFFN